MKTFIRVAEFWVPSADRSLLEFGGGLYGSATRFKHLSRSMCFGRGEGLPGAAWEAGRPIMLKELADANFRRADAARVEGLTCGIALPVFAGEFLMAVLVFFCGDDEEHAGAIELWRNLPAESKDLTLVDGYYGTTGDTFEYISRRTSLRRGIGLPGMAWEAGVPVFLADLGKGSGFIRADSAVKVGINRGFAMPWPSLHDEQHVIALLSALATPIARRVEIWKPDLARERLVRSGGFCETAGALGAGAVPVDRGQGTIGRTLLTGIPAVSEDAAHEPGPVGAAARESGLVALVAVPVLNHGRLAATVSLYF